MKPERRFFEVRQAGRVLTGTAIRYGDRAQMPWGSERIEAGAFAPIGDVILNAQHDRKTPLARTDGGGLELRDSDDALEIRAELPETRPADDVLELVRRKIMRGLSIEFRAIRESMQGNLRIIHKAVLVGIAVVDRGAYTDSEVQARRAVYVAAARKPRVWL